MAHEGDREGDLWDVGGDRMAALAREVECLVNAELYDALAGLLRDPRFLVNGMWPVHRWHEGSGGEGWGVHLLIEGRGRPDIERYINCAALVREEIECDTGSDGTLDVDSVELYRRLAEGLRASAAEIEAAIGPARG